ncbi:hypothetical protein PHLGIDRAFT_114521 [Phlebiopsis gigantea 11061_1 CR5-6]|uniref:Uncharacterized protein n=1 Tax=Phlebiopsis gigantea (strain 11061_1 CR5-6) TaxID=745531 RepID=A0A0C3SD07_PHLG1|nr:hypothetical protein PHLGIDRAFT_114521 [Phlebiopsis gigantea 11061_1 CR5-6]
MDMETDMNMTDNEAPSALPPPPPQVQPHQSTDEPQGMELAETSTPAASSSQTIAFNKDKFREIPVKVHVRRPDRDTWAYVGRAIVSQEAFGQGTRIVVRAHVSRKVVTAFSEGASLQAEKRGNFVVVSCVEGGRVISWSLNALNNSETLRLLAIIELSCYTSKHTVNPDVQHSHLRRIARVIKDDRRKRHRRRKDQDAMVAAFAKTGLAEMQ